MSQKNKFLPKKKRGSSLKLKIFFFLSFLHLFDRNKHDVLCQTVYITYTFILYFYSNNTIELVYYLLWKYSKDFFRGEKNVFHYLNKTIQSWLPLFGFGRTSWVLLLESFTLGSSQEFCEDYEELSLEYEIKQIENYRSLPFRPPFFSNFILLITKQIKKISSLNDRISTSLVDWYEHLNSNNIRFAKLFTESKLNLTKWKTISSST